MFDPALNTLVLTYRCVYAVLGSYIAARYAPRNPMRHVLTTLPCAWLGGTLHRMTTNSQAMYSEAFAWG